MLQLIRRLIAYFTYSNKPKDVARAKKSYKIVERWEDDNALWFVYDDGDVAFSIKHIPGREYPEVCRELRPALRQKRLDLKRQFQSEIPQMA